MSTTFGVKIPASRDGNDLVIEVARRRGVMGGAVIEWVNDMAVLLPDTTEVIAMDNTAQGIYTIGDIKKQIDKK